MTSNTALTDEIEAVNSIYDVKTLSISTGIDASDGSSTVTILNLPDSPFSFSITFPHDYPDVPPQINGIQSTGPNTKKGDGDSALSVLRDVLGHIYTPGQVCLFDLIEEVTPLLHPSTPDSHPPHQQSSVVDDDVYDDDQDGPSQIHLEAASPRSATPLPLAVPVSEMSNLHVKDLAPDRSAATAAMSTMPEPQWALSEPVLVNKSSFVARALSVDSLKEATSAIAHLLSTNKKVASATHNVTAWRIKSRMASGDAHEITVQDCDDDGETAAGGRLLHLMQLMDVWNVVVVVTRWYGGVKLGPDRFRCINMVARDALVKGGFAENDGKATSSKEKKGRAGRKA